MGNILDDPGQNPDQNTGKATGQSIEQNIEQNFEQNIEQSNERNIGQSIEQDIEQSLEKKREDLEKIREMNGRVRSALGAKEILPALHFHFISEFADQLKKDIEIKQQEEAFSLWTKGAPAVMKLIEYVTTVTEEGNPDYIKPSDRIAVFDLDGTLFCETDPTYFDYCLLHYRVCEDPDYRDKASDFEKEVARKIEDSVRTGNASTGLDVENGKAISSAFAGFSVEEFAKYVRKVRELPARGYDGMTVGEAFYKPMLQITSYLKAHQFRIYICSGTDRMVVRGIVEGEVDVMPSEVLGTDEVLVAQSQGNRDGMDYAFGDTDKLVLGGKLLVKNLKMNKVSVIAREIGQQPVLCFGNSMGDASMAHYVTSDNPHISRVFMVCCDDLVRENGNMEKAQNMYDMCNEKGWIPISMRNDWLTIYGSGVTKKQNGMENID